MPSDIDLNRLKIFYEVALSGSFSKAAKSLKQPKSKVSRHIAALERELGVQLIYRTTRHSQLTPAGRELFQGAGPLLRELKGQLEQLMSSSEEVRGLIRVTVPDDVGVELMGTVCAEFMKLHPSVEIDLHVGNQRVDMVKESFDLALRIGKIDDSTLIRRRIGHVSLVFAMSPSFRSRYAMHRIEDLENAPFLAFSSVLPKNHTIRIMRGKEEKKVHLKPVFAANNFFVLRDMAISGLGYTVLSPFLMQTAFAGGELVPIFKDWMVESNPVQILFPQQKEVPLRVRRFSDFLSEKISLYI